MSHRPSANASLLSTDESHRVRAFIQRGATLLTLPRGSEPDLLKARTAKLQWHLSTWKELQGFAQGCMLSDGFQLAGKMPAPPHGAPLGEFLKQYDDSLRSQLRFLDGLLA